MSATEALRYIAYSIPNTPWGRIAAEALREEKQREEKERAVAQQEGAREGYGG